MSSQTPQGSKDSGWLTGKMLVAMPSMQDPRFARTVTLLCRHAPDGAMGIILNRLYGDINYQGLLNQLNITMTPGVREMPVHFGGPVEPGRGFILHSTDYQGEGTLVINDGIALTATIEILRALAEGRGPLKAILALGYAGWSPGQLETELQTTGWLIAPADNDIIFDPDFGSKWERSLAKIGVSPHLLSGDTGHA